MKVELISYTPQPIDAIEEAASTCYDSIPTGGKIFDHCYKSGHHSVLEFADFSFRISGVSRALSHQLVRHRIASYAQRSQRYCSEKDFEHVVPATIESIDAAVEEYETCMTAIGESYEKLQQLGVPNEDARMVLPNACYTTICVKMNLRTFMHFCNERLCNCAQWEIRKMCQLMKNEVVVVEPRLDKILVPKCMIHSPYNFCTETKKRSCGRAPLIKDIFNYYEKWLKVTKLLESEHCYKDVLELVYSLNRGLESTTKDEVSK